MTSPVLVLGAGIIGVSIAIHLRMRGRDVVLLDRRDAGEETSYGNAGLIQREGVMPYAFPQDFGAILGYAGNTKLDMHYHPSTLPIVAPFLTRYWWASRAENYPNVVKGYAPLIAACLSEHAPLIEKAGAGHLIEKKGWYRVFRTNGPRDTAFRDAEALSREYGVNHAQLSGGDIGRLEPAIKLNLAGALHWTDPWSIRDPGGLVRAYRDLFVSLGGVVVHGDAMTLAAQGSGWRAGADSGPVEAAEVVVALGPWSGDLTSSLGYHLPLGVKRGYHMHYTQPTTPLGHWLQDAERGYMLAPMVRGIRLTTGAEFALRDAASTPVQLDRAEIEARDLIELGTRVDSAPWRGARPCTPDMLPVIGPAPRHRNLWFAFGHAHHGMTLGPATGRLLAEQMSGDTPFIDPTPYLPSRFVH